VSAGRDRRKEGTAIADFTTFKFQLNTGTNATPVWTDVPASGAGTGQEIRFSDVNTAGATASASWPNMTRPAATGQVNYQYVFTADTTSLGYVSTSSTTPTTWANANYMDLRMNWDNLGTFASAPIFTAYASTAHAAISRGDGSILGGHATDTGGTARSYLKGNMFGRVTSAGAVAAAPTNAPTVTDGATGALSPTAGANWATNYQGLQGDNDWLAFPSTPAATTADTLNLMMTLFTGPNMNAGIHVPVISAKYTYI
jgi:hypothetical protein